MTTHAPRPVLYATELRFWQRDTGATQRIASLCAHLVKSGYPLHVYFPDAVSPAERGQLEALLPGVVLWTPTFMERATRAVLRRLGALLGYKGLAPRHLPPSLQRPWIAQRVAAFERAAQTARPDVIVIAYLPFGYLVEPARICLPGTPVYLDTIDVLSVRAERFRKNGAVVAFDISRADEAVGLARFDALLAIQPDEAETLRALCPSAKVVSVPHGILVMPQAPSERQAPTLLFIGGTADHNVLAARRLLHELWPIIVSELPSARLIVGGSVCDVIETPADPYITFAPSRATQARYAEADVVINPVTVGSGLKIKNVEALCLGMPLVTTPIGAEGMLEGAGAAYLLGEDNDTLVAHTVALLSDAERRKALRAGALAYAERTFSPEAAYAPLLELLEHACYGEPGSA